MRDTRVTRGGGHVKYDRVYRLWRVAGAGRERDAAARRTHPGRAGAGGLGPVHPGARRGDRGLQERRAADPAARWSRPAWRSRTRRRGATASARARWCSARRTSGASTCARWRCRTCPGCGTSPGRPSASRSGSGTSCCTSSRSRARPRCGGRSRSAARCRCGAARRAGCSSPTCPTTSGRRSCAPAAPRRSCRPTRRPRTSCSPRCERCRERGYALAFGETLAGVNTVAAGAARRGRPGRRDALGHRAVDPARRGGPAPVGAAAARDRLRR